MKYLVIKAPIWLNVIIAVISGWISWFGLLFGIAHLFEEPNPDSPRSEHYVGVAMVGFLCILGIAFLILFIASIRGIIARIMANRSKSDHK